MKCGVCGSPLVKVGTSRLNSRGEDSGGRRNPRYSPCPRLNDPEAHPARFKDGPYCENCEAPTLNGCRGCGARICTVCVTQGHPRRNYNDPPELWTPCVARTAKAAGLVER